MSYLKNIDEFKNELVPQFSHILLNLTTDCNLRCPYCYFKDYHYEHRYMTPETCKKVLNYCEFLKIKTLHLFGGEPLLNFKELALEIQEFAFKNPEVEILMTTNGTLLNDEIIEILENLPNFTLSFTFLSREDVDNTQIIKKVIEQTKLNYFITAVISPENIHEIIEKLKSLPIRKQYEFINLQPENPRFSPFEDKNIEIFKREVNPILKQLGVYNLYKISDNNKNIKDFLRIDSQLKVSPEGDFTLYSIYDDSNIGYIGNCQIEPNLLFKYLQTQTIFLDGDLCQNCPLINIPQCHCYMNKPIFYKLLDGPNDFLCGWGKVLYEMINSEEDNVQF